MSNKTELERLERKEKKIRDRLDSLTRQGADILDRINNGGLTTQEWIEQSKALYINSKKIARVEQELRTQHKIAEAIKQALEPAKAEVAKMTA